MKAPGHSARDSPSIDSLHEVDALLQAPRTDTPDRSGRPRPARARPRPVLLLLTLVTCLLGMPAAASAQSPDDLEAAVDTTELIEQAELTVDEVLTHLELHAPDTCEAYRTTESLLERKRRWRRAIDVLARTHPDFLYDWLVGERQPPRVVLEETTKRRDCLVDALMRDARAEPERLTVNLDFGGGLIENTARLQRWARRYKHDRSRRRRVRRALTASHHRTAEAQGSIWRQKFLLHREPFQQISDWAARACDLSVGDHWDRRRRPHRRCWQDVLTGRHREREILAASAAPGISRHHWGTEVDFFGLEAEPFRQGPLRDEYRWMQANALRWGFFEPYRPVAAPDHHGDHGSARRGYVDEPWHWSYFPVGQALTEFAADNRDRYEAELENLWDRLNRRFRRQTGSRMVFIDYVRDHWPRYVFGLASPRMDVLGDDDA